MKNRCCRSQPAFTTRSSPLRFSFPMSKVILITGANRGIGFCIAQGIAERLENCCILVASRKLSAAEDAIAKLQHLKATFEPVELDVTSDDSITACLETIRTNHGRLDGTSTHPLTMTQEQQ